MKPIFGRTPSLQLRLISTIIISIGLMVIDSRLVLFNQIRSTYLDTLISPLYYVANVPSQLLNHFSERFSAKSQLMLENRALRQELLLKNSDLLVLNQFKQENIRLRKLLASPLKPDQYKMITEVLSMESDPKSYQIVINKGQQDHVYIGQPVMNDQGVVGQIVGVAQTTSRVLLICDSSHALPVEIAGKDIRGILSGNGCLDDMILEYLPMNAEVTVGDQIVTSGLGGGFPEGYPVAIVSSVRTDKKRAHTFIYAKPIAGIERLRYLLLVWSAKHLSEYPLLKRTATETSLLSTALKEPQPLSIEKNDDILAMLTNETIKKDQLHE